MTIRISWQFNDTFSSSRGSRLQVAIQWCLAHSIFLLLLCLPLPSSGLCSSFFFVLLQSVLHASQVPRQRHNQLETNCLRKDSHSLALIKTNPRALTKTKTNTLTNHCTKTTLELESKQVHWRLQNLMLGLTSLLRGEDNKGEQRKKLGVKKKAQM